MAGRQRMGSLRRYAHMMRGRKMRGELKSVEFPTGSWPGFYRILRLRRGIISFVSYRFYSITAPYSCAVVAQTVILDCCYSGGITRETPKASLTARFLETPSTIKISPSIDNEIWSSIYAQAVDVEVLAGFRRKNIASHVVLAACGDQEYAYETTTADGLPRGFFTDNLIKQLHLVDLNRTTYADLPSQLPELINQKPLC